jgi:methylmalonyl-CoA/ethylmalonyl-CoA epimerase
MTPSSYSGLSRIGQIAIAVKDVKRAEAFYRDVLGMKHLFSFPGIAFFDCGGVRLFLSKAEKPEFDHTSTIYYRVGAIGDIHATLSNRGVKFVDSPHIVHQDDRHELWMVFFKDSEGNNLALMEERQKRL